MDKHRPNVKLYIGVFAALMVLTCVTVVISKSDELFVTHGSGYRGDVIPHGGEGNPWRSIFYDRAR